MADTKLDVTIEVKDKFSGGIKNVNKQLNTVQKTSVDLTKKLRGVGIALTAIGTGITVFFGAAIKQAAVAEGAFAKFNTVFGEGTEDMMEFINDIRKRMPIATTQIVRMAADLQDLLIPLGLTREKGAELTKGFVELANQLAAFNDVDPTDVLEAFKSGLAGSSEPLRRFGINALESSLEARALEEGLLGVGQKFTDLDVNVKNQIRAQALLAQSISNSSDAIAGFEANNDSLIRRQQELKASISEVSERLGIALLPIIDSVAKKIIPIIERIADWIEQNPRLAEGIVIVVAALGALALVVGPILIALPAIIAFFTALVSPIGLVVVAIFALIAVGKILVNNWGAIQARLGEIWQGIKDNFVNKIEEIKQVWTDVMESIANIGKAIWSAVTGNVRDSIQIIKDEVSKLLNFLKDAAIKIAQNTVFGKAFGGVANAIGGLQARANGGPVSRNTPFLVGERGPEIFTPSQSGSIIPNNKLGGAGTTINITVNGDVTGDAAVERIGDELVRRFQLSTAAV